MVSIVFDMQCKEADDDPWSGVDEVHFARNCSKGIETLREEFSNFRLDAAPRDSEDMSFAMARFGELKFVPLSVGAAFRRGLSFRTASIRPCTLL